MSMSFDDEVCYANNFYSKISYDVSKIKDISKIHKAYDIDPEDEYVIAYVKSPVFLMPLTMSGIIITDKGLYSKDQIFPSGQKNKLPFEELCKYAFFKEGEKDPLYIIDVDFRKPIWGSSLLGANTIGDELLAFLTDMQEQLMSKYPWAVEQRDELVKKTIDKGKEELKTCSLSREIRGILNVVSAEERYSDMVAPVCTERVYRKRGLAYTEEFISGLSDSVSPKVLKELEESLELFGDNFIKDISNSSLVFDSKYLQTILDNVDDYIKSNEVNALKFTAYISARLGDIEKLKDAQKTILSELGSKEAFDLEYFKCKSSNTLMKTVFDIIEDDEIPDKSLLKLQDNFGFDALHYAIILGKEDVIEKLLDMDIYMDQGGSGESELHKKMLSYGVIAQLCNLDIKDKICMGTSEYVKAQAKVFKSLKRRLKAKEIQISIQRKSETMYNRAMSEASRQQDRAKFEDFRLKSYNVKELIRETEAQLRDIEMEISEFENELASYILEIIKENNNIADKILNSNNEFIKLLVNIIKNPDMLLSALSADNPRMYIFQNISFLLAENIEVNIPYIDMTTDEISEDFNAFWSAQEEPEIIIEEETKSNKPYGNSWFSPKAHSDEKVLKEEYRKLAKIYHPDISKTEESKAIFQEINNERADILDSFE